MTLGKLKAIGDAIVRVADTHTPMVFTRYRRQDDFTTKTSCTRQDLVSLLSSIARFTPHAGHTCGVGCMDGSLKGMIQRPTDDCLTEIPLTRSSQPVLHTRS